MHDYPTNNDRAAWAAAATTTFGRLTGQDDPSYLIDSEAIAKIAGDLICDLLHFVNVAGGDPIAVTYNAIGHFEYEVAEEAEDAAAQLEAGTLPMLSVNGVAYPASYELTAADRALHDQAAACLSTLNRHAWWERAAGAVATWWNCAAYRLTGRSNRRGGRSGSRARTPTLMRVAPAAFRGWLSVPLDVYDPPTS